MVMALVARLLRHGGRLLRSLGSSQALRFIGPHQYAGEDLDVTGHRTIRLVTRDMTARR